MFRFFRSRKAPPRPLRVAYDILRMSAGGANGGIKAHHYEFLRRLSEAHGGEISLVVLCREEIVPELAFLSAGPANQILVIDEKGAHDYRDNDGTLPPLQFWPEPPDNLLESLGIELLYAGFGFSRFYSPRIPQISLIVDVLHRAIPDSLPPAEVAFRERWYREAIEKSVFVQTNSRFCLEALQNLFGASPEKLYHIYLPLHGRFNRVEMGSLPAELAPIPKRYFLYPANFWPHKNHARLIDAYASYREQTAGLPYDLALTGHPNESRADIQKRVSEKGLSAHVHFLGHHDDPTYKAIWELAAGLVFPSLYEGFGLPILEAAYFQKPIACSRAGSLAEIAPPSACLFDPEDASSIADALLKLHQDPERYRATEDYLLQYELDAEAKKLKAHLRATAALEPG